MKNTATTIRPRQPALTAQDCAVTTKAPNQVGEITAAFCEAQDRLDETRVMLNELHARLQPVLSDIPLPASDCPPVPSYNTVVAQNFQSLTSVAKDMARQIDSILKLLAI